MGFAIAAWTDWYHRAPALGLGWPRETRAGGPKSIWSGGTPGSFPGPCPTGGKCSLEKLVWKKSKWDHQCQRKTGVRYRVELRASRWKAAGQARTVSLCLSPASRIQIAASLFFVPSLPLGRRLEDYFLEKTKGPKISDTGAQGAS